MPQGSITERILFVIFMIDILEVLNGEIASQLTNYAADTNVFISSNYGSI